MSRAYDDIAVGNEVSTSNVTSAAQSQIEKKHGPEDKITITADLEDSDPPFNPGLRFYLAFSSLCVIILAAALDATALSVALPIIAQDLHGTAIEAFWTGTSFLLTSTVIQPTFASISHILGRKPSILVSVSCFAIGSLICALAHSFTVLLVGRTIQGIGGGGIVALTEVVITDIVPLRERGTWFGFQTLIWAVGSVTGPLIGGSLAQYASWRWIFWINLPICGVGIVMTVLFLKLNKRSGNLLSHLRRFDFVGCVLLTGSVTSFLIPVSWGGVMFAWSSWHTLVPLVLGVLGIVGFLFYENWVKEPLVPLGIFKRRTAMVNYIGTFTQGIIIWSIVYYIPLYYEGVKGYSPTIVGVAVFPETFTIAPAAIAIGVAISKTGRFRWAIWAGWSITVLGMGVLYNLDQDTSIPAWIFMNIVAGIGLGMLYNSLAYATQSSVSQDDVAFAAAMYTFMRSFGQAVGVAIGGVIFQSQFRNKLSSYSSLASNYTELANDASGLVQVIRGLPDDDPEKLMIIHAYADALKVLWAVMAGLAGVAGLLSLGTEELSLEVKLGGEQGLREDNRERTVA
ncbi:hypothetical protein MFRU_063g00100 [Monilinia fructicola]|nr:hypothetical protein MFRU_063g00100 [Monilinia fructicola]